MTVSTVDAFQGQERSIIIYSTVRDDAKGFVKDPQRLCVALTRARHSLWIVGHAGQLWKSSPLWRGLLTQLGAERRIFVVPDSPFNLFAAETPPPVVFSTSWTTSTCAEEKSALRSAHQQNGKSSVCVSVY